MAVGVAAVPTTPDARSRRLRRQSTPGRSSSRSASRTRLRRPTAASVLAAHTLADVVVEVFAVVRPVLPSLPFTPEKPPASSFSHVGPVDRGVRSVSGRSSPPRVSESPRRVHGTGRTGDDVTLTLTDVSDVHCRIVCNVEPAASAKRCCCPQSTVEIPFSYADSGTFEFAHVFHSDFSNSDLFERVHPLVMDSILGVNTAVVVRCLSFARYWQPRRVARSNAECRLSCPAVRVCCADVRAGRHRQVARHARHPARPRPAAARHLAGV